MKTKNILSLGMIATIALSIMLSSCETNPEVKSQQTILPETFRVEIPSTIKDASSTTGRFSRSKEDTLKGNDIYLNLATFIAVGDGASKLVEAFIGGIRQYHIDRVMTLTFKSDDDARVKNLVVKEDVSFENVTYDYQLTITDADSEGNSDGGKALQIFWNKSASIKGVAIIKPYNCDRNKNVAVPDAMFRVNYSEQDTSGYDAQMEVLISGLPLPSALENPYAVNTLRMFVGKKGDVVDVFGNTNHPNAILFAGDAGFNWAFVASGNDVKHIGVAEVGLPPSDLDTDDREVILKEYSIRNVFNNEILSVWPGINQGLLDAYLSNTAAPGYFGNHGFLSGGVSPGADWDALAERLEGLAPYNPSEVSALDVTFK